MRHTWIGNKGVGEFWRGVGGNYKGSEGKGEEWEQGWGIVMGKLKTGNGNLLLTEHKQKKSMYNTLARLA